MPTITVYHHGATGGVPPTRNDHLRKVRSEVRGWSDKSIRSNTRFLYSVLESRLTGWGASFTLTVRDCPPDHATWVKLREAFADRLRRRGMLRLHWVTEWQRRGVPHLHGAVWMPEDSFPGEWQMRQWIIDQWVAVARQYFPMARGQHSASITDLVGWFKYLSKHAARGLLHYQRSPEGIPAGWERTGRMWGYLGSWERLEGCKFETDRYGWFAYRRIMRRYRIADARAAGSPRRIVQARTMLRDNDRSRSEVRGFSEWIEFDVSMRALAFLGSVGFRVDQVG